MPDEPEKEMVPIEETPEETPAATPEAVQPFSDDGIKAWQDESLGEQQPPEPEAHSPEEEPEEPKKAGEEEEPEPEKGEGEEEPEKIADEPFEVEKLTPEQKAYLENLKKQAGESEELKLKQTELEKRLTDTGREKAVLEKAVQGKQDAHQALIEQNKSQYEAKFEEAKDEQRGWDKQANDLEAEAVEAEADDDYDRAKSLREEARKARKNSYSWEQFAISLSDAYNKWESQTILDHTRDMEEAYLSEFSQFKDAKSHIDRYCREHDLNPVKVKSNPKLMHNVYKNCFYGLRGSDESIKKITEGAKKLAIQEFLAKLKAGGPGAGSSSGVEPKEEKDWTDSMTEKQKKKRYDPEAI